MSEQESRRTNRNRKYWMGKHKKAMEQNAQLCKELEEAQAVIGGDISILELREGKLTLEHPMFKVIAGTIHEMFINEGAENYLEVEVCATDRESNEARWYVLTFQNKDGLTPHQKYDDAQEQLQLAGDTIAARDNRITELEGAIGVTLHRFRTMDVDGKRVSIEVPEDSFVNVLCETYGYGAVMDSAARQWFLKDNEGAFVVGPCALTGRNGMKALREVLQKDKEDGADPTTLNSISVST